jgi:hypothetical protein
LLDTQSGGIFGLQLGEFLERLDDCLGERNHSDLNPQAVWCNWQDAHRAPVR